MLDVTIVVTISSTRFVLLRVPITHKERERESGWERGGESERERKRERRGGESGGALHCIL